MQGKKHYEERLFSTINLKNMIPKNHLLMRIDKAINLDFIYELTSDLYCSDNGRPSIDPVLFFRIQLIGYLYGIKSDRKLCEEIHLNIAYRWFCHLHLEDSVPDHSSLTRIRDRFGVESYQAVFERMVQLLRENGFIKGQRVMVDASLVEANASVDSLQERQDSDPEARELRDYEKRYHDFREGKKKRKVSNQTHVSKTDLDSTLVARPGAYGKLFYKVHYAMDGKNRFILDCHATTGSQHECTVLPERINYLLGQMKMPILEVIADKGYGRGPTYSFLREHNIRSYIPLHNDNLGRGRLSKIDFKYDKKHDRYICPNNKSLYPYDKWDHGIIKRYRVVGGHCKTCPLKTSCLPENHKNRSRFMYRSPHQDEIDKIKKRQTTNHFKRKLTERQWKLEGLFGEAKENHCLRRAKYRGLKKMQIQFYMTAIVQNLKRLVGRILKYLGKKLMAVRVILEQISEKWKVVSFKIEIFTEFTLYL